MATDARVPPGVPDDQGPRRPRRFAGGAAAAGTARRAQPPGQRVLHRAGRRLPFAGPAPRHRPVLDDIRENLAPRRYDEYLARKGDGTATHSHAPVRIDASHLTTAWPRSSERDRPRDDHHLPGAVALAQAQAQAQALPVTTLQPGRPQRPGHESWQTLGGKPKAALNCNVTFSIDASRPEQMPPVARKVIGIELAMGPPWPADRDLPGRLASTEHLDGRPCDVVQVGMTPGLGQVRSNRVARCMDHARGLRQHAGGRGRHLRS